VNRLATIIIALFFLNQCSFNENSRIWKEKEIENKKNIKKIFLVEKKITAEFNQELKLDLSKIRTNNKIIDNQNNYGSQEYNGSINKIGNYKFSKLDNINQLNYKPLFLNDGLIFFDNKGSIIRYDNNQKVLWKTNHYSKTEKKLKPRLNFVLEKENLLVTDSIAKYYSVNINTGEVNWSKNNTYPFNSEIKKNKKNSL
jgi:outer membrane protein assembly factor BamB